LKLFSYKILDRTQAREAEAERRREFALEVVAKEQLERKLAVRLMRNPIQYCWVEFAISASTRIKPTHKIAKTVLRAAGAVIPQTLFGAQGSLCN